MTCLIMVLLPWHTSGAVPLSLPCLQARVRAIADIVGALVQGVKNGEDVDLNLVKREVSIKYGLGKAPKLVEIIAALPEEHRAVLLPQ
jgi:elongator complex protein 3